VSDQGSISLAPVGNERPKLAEQALDTLRAAVLDGRMRPGELYSVAQLADRLGVSRTPVREALLALERQGLVRFERNRGVRVMESSAHDLDEIFALRLLLEVPTARQAAERFDADDLADLEGLIAQMSEHVDDPDDTQFMAYDRAFHERVLAAAGNRRMLEVVAGMRDFVRFRGVSTVKRGRSMRTILREHERILDALRDGDADGAAEAMREHLVNTRGVLLASPED
jgi:DNA-binding GntR family transcriptional regulator